MRTGAAFGWLATAGLVRAHTTPDADLWETPYFDTVIPRAAGRVPYSAADPAYNTTIKHFECGTEGSSHASDDFLKTVSQLSNAPKTGSAFPRALLQRRNSRVNVPMYVHVVTTNAKANSVPQSMVHAQVRTMNTVYNPYNIYFNLKGIDFTANNDWAVGSSSDSDMAMKNSLRQGTYNALNLYFQTDLVGGILGKCSLPTSIGDDPDRSVYVGDGCNIAAGTMPGGPIMGYNMGMTAVHETGHWLGLLHTFEGYSCSGKGDYIDDTPPESVSTSGCPTSPWKNSCPRPAGFFNTRKGDPIRNYMDYSIDACYAGFTNGQIDRIGKLWKLYRSGN